MAAFNKSDNQPVIQSGFITSSRGYSGDDSLGILFKGLGDTLGNVTTALDESYKAQADIDAFDLVESTVAESMPSETMPPEATAAVADIRNLQGAKAQGAMPQVEFNNKIMTRVKAARSRLPKGYHPIFERAVASALSSSTANDARKTRLSAIDDAIAGADASTKEKRGLIDKEGNKELLYNPNVQAEYQRQTGKKLDDAAISGLTFDTDPLLASMAKERSRLFGLEAKSKEAGYKKEETEAYFKEKTVGVLKEVFNASHQKYGDFLKEKEKATLAGGPGGAAVTPEEGKAMLRIFSEVAEEARQKGLALINEDDNASNLSREGRENTMKAIDDTIGLYQKALSGKEINYGLLDRLAFENSYIQEYDKNWLMINFPEQVREKSLQDMGVSSQTLDTFNASTTELKNKKEAWFKRAATDLAITGLLPEAEALKKVQEDPSKPSPNVARRSIADVGKILNSDLPADQIAKIGNNIFSKENEAFLKSLPQEYRIQVFQQRMTPKTYETLKKADPEAAKRMARWGTVQFPAIADRAFRTIYETQKSGTLWEMSWDGKQFQSNQLSGDPVKPFASPLNNIWGVYQESRASSAERAKNDINVWIQAMEPIWKDQGMSVEEGVRGSFENIDPNEIIKEGSVFEQMGKALGDFFGEIPGGPEGKKSGETAPPKVAPQNKDPRQEGSIDNSFKKLAAFIQKAEGADYNTMYGGSKAPLDTMTVAQVLAYNKAHSKSAGSSATGGFQVMHDTLKELVAAGVVEEDDLFNQDTQDVIGKALAKRRGLGRFLKGSMTADQFADNLASEWASLPLKSGKSKYAKDGVNKATVSRQEVLQLLQEL